ncbi:MAG: hypothetical protein QOE75_2601 [Solirubrobacterales bacterium]|nr:hypothetical protein [Solirubrobacterales bacterium]
MNLARPLALVSALAVLALAAWAPTAGAAPGDVRVQAEATYHEAADGSVNGVRLQIFRDGAKVVDRPPPIPCSGCALRPYPVGYATKPAQVVQLDATPEPEVVFALLSGGAHCCIYAQIFRWDEALGRYLAATHDFRDNGFVLKDLRHDGVPEFFSNDTRLAYRFSCYLCAVYPTQLWAYDSGRLSDVTRSFPRQVKNDLAETRRFYYRALGKGDVRGLLATIAADQCLLGHCSAGFRFVRRAIAAGHVRAREPRWEYGPHGHKYLRELRRFLRKLGYV